MFVPLQVILPAWEHGELNDIWQFICIMYKKSSYKKRVAFFYETLLYGMDSKLLLPYQELENIKESFQGSNEGFISLLEAYMPETEKELNTVNPIIHFLQFDFPYYEMLKSKPFGSTTKLNKGFNFLENEWALIESSFIAVLHEKELLKALDIVLRLFKKEKVDQSDKLLEKWLQLGIETHLFWPQATENGFTPVPEVTSYLRKIVGLIAQYDAVLSIPKNELMYPYLQWFVDKEPVEWIKFELKESLRIIV